MTEFTVEEGGDRNIRNLLVLGGTTEGYELPRVLYEIGRYRIITSLAGRTREPRLPVGEVRIGGFGGATGLAEFLRERQISAVIDATHPFAAAIGWNAAVACQQTSVPLLRVERPAWRPVPGDQWHEIGEWTEAARIVAAKAGRVLLAIGRQELDPFAPLDHVWFLIRSVEAPCPMPPFYQAELLLARGPFDLAGERALLAGRRIDTVVCKNSGGTATDAKLIAARELGIRVVMQRRPPRPEVPAVTSVADALNWLAAR
jgi:precorrin-6A/cobalt-precorrin-6A reductase